MRSKIWLLCLVALAASFSVPAQAQEAGDWLFKAGVWTVSPKSDNSTVANVDSGTSLGFNATYMFTSNFGIEVLASLPFSHDINLNADGSQVAETKHLPPTVTAQYHFPVSDRTTVYAGLGLNWTIFFDEQTSGALDGTDLELDDSLGLALQIGADIDISDKMFFNVDVRYMDIDTDAELDGAALATVEIDPWVAGINLGWRF